MRLTLLDGMRGHLLIGMLVVHLSFNDGLGFLFYVHHNTLIQLYDAEFFIFIAGLLVGHLWATRYPTATLRKKFALNRLRTIYVWYAISAIPYVLSHPEANPNLIAGTVEVLLMEHGGWFSDILPIYFVCFALLLPFAVWSALYRPGALLGISFAIYVASQLTNRFGFFGFTGKFVAFDIAAWQFIFFLSMMVGRSAPAWRAMILGLSRRTVLIAFPVLVAVLVWLGQWPHFPDPMQIVGGATNISARNGLHPLYIVRIAVAILAMALVVLRSDAWLGPIHRAVHWYFMLPVIRNVGRYSIQMFSLHVYILALYTVMIHDLPEPSRIAYAVLSVIAFVAAPNIYAAMKERGIGPARSLR